MSNLVGGAFYHSVVSRSTDFSRSARHGGLSPLNSTGSHDHIVHLLLESKRPARRAPRGGAVCGRRLGSPIEDHGLLALELGIPVQPFAQPASSFRKQWT